MIGRVLLGARALVLLLWGVSLPRPAAAQAPAPNPGAGAEVEDAPTAEAKAAAQQRFQEAQEFYQQGNYREAQGALEAALALDPRAKDLTFNLGVVHEKLGRIDEALAAFRRYLDFDLEPAERARAEKYIRRLEGARTQAPSAAPPPVKAEAPPPPPAPSSPVRLDGATVAAAGVTVLALGVGTIFAVDAGRTRPPDGFVTGRDGSYAELQDRVDSAHRSAVIADVAFVVSALAAATTAYLAFGRPAPKPGAALFLPPVPVAVPGGAALGMGAAF